MKYIVSTLFLTITAYSSSINAQENKKILHEKPSLQTILDDSNVKGTILVFDAQKGEYYANNFQEAEKSYIPASTYKIPHSIIGLETGVLENEKTRFEWNGKKRALKTWEKDLTLREAFQVSCVPCYQELAKKIGTQRMNEQLKRLNFGNMVVNDDNLDMFWLKGKSSINAYQQIDFLKRFTQKKLPIKDSTYETLKHIMKIDSTEEGVLSGKKGLGLIANSYVGWFVGYVEKGNNTVYIATRIVPKQKMSMKDFAPIRMNVTLSALKALNVIKTPLLKNKP